MSQGYFSVGGIDSSDNRIASGAEHPSCASFTIGFEEAGFNEAPYARAVAIHLGTDHSETILTAADAQALIPHYRGFIPNPSPMPPSYRLTVCAKLDSVV